MFLDFVSVFKHHRRLLLALCTVGVIFAGFMCWHFGGFDFYAGMINEHLFGQNQRAVENYSAAIDKNPEYAVAYYGRASAYSNLHRYEDAVNDSTKAIAIDPEKWPMYYLLRAIAYDRLGQYQKVLEDCSKTISLDPRNAAAYAFRGIAYGKLEQHQKALEDCSKAINFDPTNAMMYRNRGVAYDRLGEYQKAIEDYSKAISLDPKSPWAYQLRGITYGKLGQYENDIDDSSAAISRYTYDAAMPPLWTMYAQRGYAFGNLRQYQKEIDDRTKVINLAPNNGGFYFIRGETYEKLGKKDLAAKDREMAARLGYKPKQK